MHQFKLKKIQIFSIAIFISLFILFYFTFLINLYNFSNNFVIPIISLIGFAIIIIGIFYFFLDIKNKLNTRTIVLRLEIANENTIKTLLLILMILTFFFPRVTFSETIIDWNQISLLSYIRAFVFLIGIAFIPGACVYNIAFPKNPFPKKFNVESFIFKITLYPILSFTLLGTLTLFLDFIGLSRQFFSTILFLSIIVLFISDLLIQNSKHNIKFQISKSKLKITNTSLFIIFIAIGVIIIALGVHISTSYLIPGDSWRGINYAYFIGQENEDILSKFSGIDYTVYWGYISYSISALCGIPYININVLLVIFEYLFVTSTYLFMKGLLSNLKEKYILLSTIFSITFSGLFYVLNPYLGKNNLSALIFDGIINFRYKSFAHVSVITALSIFVIIARNSKESNLKSLFKYRDYPAVILIAFLMIQSFMIYFLPLIAGLSFVVIYSIFSINKTQNLRLLLSFILYFIIIFIFLDVISIFFFSWISKSLLFFFIGLPTELFIESLILNALFFYFGLFCLFIFCYSVNKLYLKHTSNRFKRYHKIKPIYLFIIFIGLFSFLIEIQVIFINILKFEQNFFTFYLSLTLSNFGFIGIFGIYLSYSVYSKNKKLFNVLFLWGCVIYLIASILIFKNWIEFFNLLPQEIPRENYFNMMYWFSRNWYIVIFPLSIFFSISILRLRKYIQRRKWAKPKKNIRLINSLIYSSMIIFLSLSNTIIAGMEWYNWYKVSDDEAQIIGWISENLPVGTKILADQDRFNPLNDIIHGSTFLYDIRSEMIDALGVNDYYLLYYTQEYIQWNVTHSYDINCSSFIIEQGNNSFLNINDNNAFGISAISVKFNEKQRYGYIELNFSTNDSSKRFDIILNGLNNSKVINIYINSSNLYCFNGEELDIITNLNSNVWYNLTIFFESSEESNYGLNRFEWKISLNNMTFGPYKFSINDSNLQSMNFQTNKDDSDWNVSISNLKVSWKDSIQLEKCIFKIPTLINHLKKEGINYFIFPNQFENKFKLYELVNTYFKKLIFEYNTLKIYSI